MISYIKGRVAYADPEYIIIDNHGIGYRVRSSARACERLHPGEEAMLYTWLYVREDALSLFGFLTSEELHTFQVVLGVSGIGPKAALSLLSTLTVEELYFAVFSEDSKAIAKTPGIGPKGAKRLIVELKDKLHLEDIGIGEDDGGSAADWENGSAAAEGDAVSDTIAAMVALGYSAGEAYRAVHKVPDAETMDAERLIKEALKAVLTL